MAAWVLRVANIISFSPLRVRERYHKVLVSERNTNQPAEPEHTMFYIESKYNPTLILCTDGEFHARGVVGPGGYSAHEFKTRAGAERRAGRRGDKVVTG